VCQQPVGLTHISDNIHVITNCDTDTIFRNCQAVVAHADATSVSANSRSQPRTRRARQSTYNLISAPLEPFPPIDWRAFAHPAFRGRTNVVQSNLTSEVGGANSFDAAAICVSRYSRVNLLPI